jgi:hypothetical protein
MIKRNAPFATILIWDVSYVKLKIFVINARLIIIILIKIFVILVMILILIVSNVKIKVFVQLVFQINIIYRMIIVIAALLL